VNCLWGSGRGTAIAKSINQGLVRPLGNIFEMK